jgi:hypothetical protein
MSAIYSIVEWYYLALDADSIGGAAGSQRHLNALARLQLAYVHVAVLRVGAVTSMCATA